MQVEEKCECSRLKNSTKYLNNSDKISPELELLIDKIAKKEGFVDYNLFVRNVQPDGNNYLGLLNEVTLVGTDQNEDLNLFVKSILPSPEDLTLLSLPEAYYKEVYCYTELSKLFDKYQAEANIPIQERYKFVKVYSDKTSQDHIVMDNMIKKGFTIWNRFDVISLEFAVRAIKLMAKFHALGFVLEEKDPKYFENNIKNLRYPLKFDEECKKFFTNMGNTALDYFEGNAKRKLDKFVAKLPETMEKCINDRNWTLCLCHGDFRPNNILVQINDGKITDMVPVDYQIINYGSPLVDLIYFIYGSTDRKFRQKHLDYLKNLYYDTMKKFFKYFNMDIQKYYSREEYEKLFKERQDFGLATGVWYYQLNMKDPENVKDLSTKQFADMNLSKNSQRVKVRLQELVDEFTEKGFL